MKNGSGAAFLAGLLLFLGLAFGCVDPEDERGASTSGTSMYVFDAHAGTVLAYDDLAALFESSTIQPTRTISGDLLEKVKNLAWGGMCFDSNGNRLYLVSESGDVVRIEYARSQYGNISNQNEICSFRIGASGERLPSGIFGQASFDSRDGVLYVTETNSSDTELWIIKTPHQIHEGETVSNGGSENNRGDRGGTGVAAHNGTVYAFFDGGSNINNFGISYAGPRLRKGTSSAFLPQTSLVIGEASNNRTQLAKYGSLATDLEGHVYLARHLADSSLGTANAVLFFRSGQFFVAGVNNEPPDKSFAAINNLRVISHGIRKDWLVGALSNGDAGTDAIWLWIVSRGVPSSSRLINIGSGASIRGLALDGSN
jgi:hypothetical protein